ncbi:Holliday junction ATP-dependent DNA helicase RuvA [Piscirickettsia salmonis]|uniref:Holliday junction branch migration complex subunit RuvA n=1 Tax=Piscirickettsia salmonis TaxID=1238 RepID=A0A1L6TAS6_PISSA|nr:Holliday junction branch migration protein RuvA [Piscirickettsia salmonis]AKP73467.1 Holliday junction ATP-dependent DNA helicase RuvA [Piscirickettsia salmonis LF-89 = ATCC VR-1361]ALB22223.1 holliday junction DNA helicase RuvA [Piscirickettsia salmonis]ALY02326.1 Holliday junction ATP-dependent DNA helicase RuvA [Piscirickettsia salmonis]AMA41843.1 Holliday junction ATP-dependent DNA helicase RuvA [Piscirickettsia salmonis]AOS34319.1 Holliday junction ATP-dependent DNA helicase RuvA [Pisc
MIGQLTGTIVDVFLDYLMIDVGGVGYEVFVPASILTRCGEVGQRVTLYTHLIIREDAHSLYGFEERSAKALFRVLLKANGVGPKLAMVILSTMGVSDFIQAVTLQDVAALTRLPGVGKKTAERLVIELKDKLSQFDYLDRAIKINSIDESRITLTVPVLSDAISALVALGYKDPEAAKMATMVYKEGLTCEDVIRLALKSS